MNKSKSSIQKLKTIEDCNDKSDPKLSTGELSKSTLGALESQQCVQLTDTASKRVKVRPFIF